MNALIASMSMNEKISAVGAFAALVGFFLPFLGQPASGFQIARQAGAIYILPLAALVAIGLCYLSIKATPGKKLRYAGILAVLGAACGPGWGFAQLSVLQLQLSALQLQSSAVSLNWPQALGYTAIAVGGLRTIHGFSSRVY